MEKIQSIEKNKFTGLELRNEIGEVHFPFGAKIADLKGPVFEQTFIKSNEKEFRTYINKEKLNGHLLEINSACVFRAMQNRAFIVAKVGKIHLPFYISSSGTSGKNVGEWYPFFGYDATWVIKGPVDKETGKMNYHSEVSKINEILNTNLKINLNAFSPEGDVYQKINTTQNIIGNLNEIIPYQHFSQDKSNLNESIKQITSLYDKMKELGYQEAIQKYIVEMASSEEDFVKKKKIIFSSPKMTDLLNIIKNFNSLADHEFVEKITGYSPKKMMENDGSCNVWIKDILSKI
jgi:hypothetical protein